VPDNTWRG